MSRLAVDLAMSMLYLERDSQQPLCRRVVAITLRQSLVPISAFSCDLELMCLVCPKPPSLKALTEHTAGGRVFVVPDPRYPVLT